MYFLRASRMVTMPAGLLVLVVLMAATRGQEAADSTPDMGPPLADPFPELHRAKLLAQMGVDRWHKAGHCGQGVKVAILDTGFRGYRQHLGKSLPAKVTARSFRRDEDLEARDS